MRAKPVVLTILDGWGYSPTIKGNAIAAAGKPTYDHLIQSYPNTLIQTSGPYVGLPEGQMGNSEVGHMNMGAGRVIYMDVTRIDLLISTGEFFQNPALLNAMHKAQGHRLHLLGLCSDGGVHAQLTHLFALLEMAKMHRLEHVFTHCFTDGRDTPPESGAGYIEQLERKIRELGCGQIASVSGRYYAMDRDKRWDRIERAFGAMVLGSGIRSESAADAVRKSYERGITDEFIEPITIIDGRSEPVGLIRDDDSVITFNYRADRAREITLALTDLLLEKPSRSLVPKNLTYTMMTQYDKTLTLPYVLPPEHPDNILAEVMAKAGLKNLRVAETEKYAHVTYFFNGGNEKPYAGEERELIPSPKVPTYDMQPEMSSAGITEKVVKAIEQNGFDVIVMNYANADMVGHSGKFEPTVRACEAVDVGLGEIYRALKRTGGSWIITADHGNAETMIDPVTKGPHTYHTTNPVPLILVTEPPVKLRKDGALKDIAPTILGIMGIDKPKEMKGEDLRLA
ncbi:MAG: 2,3-bisphosphoglycerate-independent phosphoglycerate mutase [Acidobacteriaceae bacterium]|nr:2,3-bisphosphoglycerate-independent phosphoglycerate mutase [Acidobacteriaceae bacterium]MBV9778959.1 2,3-bisphosphoglycerate-independent phosphoglycerate mutase [Acidobacteriaceae bacterium]